MLWWVVSNGDALAGREVRELSASPEHPWCMEGPWPSNADLVALAHAGEVEALAILLERHRPSLYAAAIGVLHNRDDALDAVQETFVVAMVKLGSLRDPAAVGGWLHRVLHRTCLLRLRRLAREAPTAAAAAPAAVATPEDAIEQLVLRDWIWAAIDRLPPDDRITVMLRYFSRCQSYEAIAAMTGVPLGTVRSRLHRARTQLATALLHVAQHSALSHAGLQRERRAEWDEFYVRLHEAPVADTYRATYAPHVEVADGVGRWRGIEDWSAHEREAIEIGVRATIIGLVASRDLTVVDIDFNNPAWADDHCPPRSTFVHHLTAGRSDRLEIRYV
jgi:RNA polymerase sigma-70 factor, ECF subfamily